MSNNAGTHWRDRLVAFGARTVVKPSLALPLPWWWHRAFFELAGRLRPMVRGVKRHRTRLGGCDTLVYAPDRPERRIFWVHGGGFVVGSPRAYARMLSAMAREMNAVVIAPSYRLAPEHPFPAGFEDVQGALAAAGDLHPGLDPLILGGDSAGGCLILATMAEALAEGRRYRGLILASPATDLDPARPVPDADDMIFPVSILRRIGRDYGQGHDPSDPRLSPVHADFTGAPPTLIHCARAELLEGDSHAVAARLREARADVTIEPWAGVPHVWHFMAGSAPAADRAIARMADFARNLP